MMKRLILVLAAVMFAVLSIVPMASAGPVDAGDTMYVCSANGKGVNLRANPSTEAGVISKLGEGKPVTVEAFVGSDWIKVTVRVDGKNVHGYIMSKFASAYDPAYSTQTFTKVRSFKVTVAPSNGSNGFVNMRAKASPSSTCIARLTKGEVLKVTAESSTYYKVTDTHGHTGYVEKAFVRK